MAEITPLDRTKNGIAILATCIVQTLNETDPHFKDRFLERLARAHRELKDNTDGDVRQQMELLAWTRTLLTGFDHINGQNQPLLGGT